MISVGGVKEADEATNHIASLSLFTPFLLSPFLPFYLHHFISFPPPPPLLTSFLITSSEPLRLSLFSSLHLYPSLTSVLKSPFSLLLSFFIPFSFSYISPFSSSSFILQSLLLSSPPFHLNPSLPGCPVLKSHLHRFFFSSHIHLLPVILSCLIPSFFLQP